MGKAFVPPIPQSLLEWIRDQALFFVSTAPTNADHHVNISPKSASQFRVADDGKSVMYLDLTGSGNETAAHLRLVPRITICFVALRGPPRILRLFGNGRYLVKEHVPADVQSRFDEIDRNDPGFRGVVIVELERISTSCGYSIPVFDVDPVPRHTLREHTLKLGFDGIAEYRKLKNCFSIDLLPGYQTLVNPDELPTRVEMTDGFPFSYDYKRSYFWNHRFSWPSTPLLSFSLGVFTGASAVAVLFFSKEALHRVG